MKRTGAAVLFLMVAYLTSARMANAKEPGSTPAVKAPPGVAYKGSDGRDRNHAVIIKGAGNLWSDVRRHNHHDG